MKWSTESAREYANQGRLEDWIHAYLSDGEWKNLGLSEGLKKAPRWWIGPIQIPIKDMERMCGPEEDIPYRQDKEFWDKKTSKLAEAFTDPDALPPVILESIDGKLKVCDGNHRCEGANKKGWGSISAVIWFNSEEAYKTSPYYDESQPLNGGHIPNGKAR